MADHDGLADVQPAGFLGDAEAESGVLELAFLHRRAADVAGGGEQVFEKGGGGQQVDAVFRQLLADPAEQRLGVPFLQPGQQHQGAQ